MCSVAVQTNRSFALIPGPRSAISTIPRGRQHRNRWAESPAFRATAPGRHCQNQRRVNLVAHAFGRLNIFVRAFSLSARTSQQSAARRLPSAVPSWQTVCQPERSTQVVDLRRPERLLRSEEFCMPGTLAVAPYDSQRVPVNHVLGLPDTDTFVVVPERRDGPRQVPCAIRSSAQRCVAQRHVTELAQSGQRTALGELW